VLFSDIGLEQAPQSELLAWVRISSVKNGGPNQWIWVEITLQLLKIYLSVFNVSRVPAGYVQTELGPTWSDDADPHAWLHAKP